MSESRVRIAAVRGTETSPDGAVTVSVNVQGALEDLRIGAAASAMNLDVLAATIVATCRQARDRARRAAVDALDASAALEYDEYDEDDDETGYTREG